MPPPAVPGAALVRFDDGAADLLAARLDELADTIAAVAVGERDRAATTVHQWTGFTRTWFDQHHDRLLNELATTAHRARTSAEAVRRAKLVAARLQQARNDEVELAQRVEIARLEQLATRAGP
ncbi:hypothetical protein BH23ACT2_BH23ACT2_19590 [soil metagenome]